MKPETLIEAQKQDSLIKRKEAVNKDLTNLMACVKAPDKAFYVTSHYHSGIKVAIDPAIQDEIVNTIFEHNNNEIRKAKLIIAAL